MPLYAVRFMYFEGERFSGGGCKGPVIKMIYTQKAEVTEIFSSVQGEGIFVGARQIFVRFKQCNMECSFCDTPNEGLVKEYSPTALMQAIKTLDESKGPHHSVSLTGGEPLVYTEFLNSFLLLLKKNRFKSYLETNGTLPLALEDVIEDTANFNTIFIPDNCSARSSSSAYTMSAIASVYFMFAYLSALSCIGKFFQYLFWYSFRLQSLIDKDEHRPCACDKLCVLIYYIVFKIHPGQRRFGYAGLHLQRVAVEGGRLIIYLLARDHKTYALPEHLFYDQPARLKIFAPCLFKIF